MRERQAERLRSFSSSDFRKLTSAPRYDASTRIFGMKELTAPLSPIAYARLKQVVSLKNFDVTGIGAPAGAVAAFS